VKNKNIIITIRGKETRKVKEQEENKIFSWLSFIHSFIHLRRAYSMSRVLLNSEDVIVRKYNVLSALLEIKELPGRRQ
jgi:hypothetical protein